ncbi:unnamed protein product, partial [Pleuronectes platessa]
MEELGNRTPDCLVRQPAPPPHGGCGSDSDCHMGPSSLSKTTQYPHSKEDDHVPTGPAPGLPPSIPQSAARTQLFKPPNAETSALCPLASGSVSDTAPDSLSSCMDHFSEFLDGVRRDIDREVHTIGSSP